MLILVVLVGLLALKVGVELWLGALNRRELSRQAGAVPEAYREVMTPEEYAKSVAYSRAKLALGQVQTVAEGVVTLVLLLGLAAMLFEGLRAWTTALLGLGVWGQAAAVLGTVLVVGLAGLPFSWWSTFRLEARFGFNHTTQRLWWLDQLKGLALGVLLGWPILALLLGFVGLFPATWWLWGALAVVAIQIVLMAIGPKLLLPLFNKLSPLPEGKLKARLTALGAQAGFTVQQIVVMDGSRRSGHANALFTGFGRQRRAILYDTLIDQLRPVELEAVLAHEIGHCRRGHLPKLLVKSALATVVGFGAVFFLANNPGWLAPLGFSVGVAGTDAAAVALLVAMLFGGLATFWLTPLGSLQSRRYEFEADSYARDLLGGDPQPLIGALRRLHQKNLSNLTPHPIYASFYYSHPTLSERENALRALPQEMRNASAKSVE